MTSSIGEAGPSVAEAAGSVLSSGGCTRRSARGRGRPRCGWPRGSSAMPGSSTSSTRTRSRSPGRSWRPAVMDPAPGAPAGWAVPEITTAVALAGRFGLTPRGTGLVRPPRGTPSGVRRAALPLPISMGGEAIGIGPIDRGPQAATPGDPAPAARRGPRPDPPPRRGPRLLPRPLGADVRRAACGERRRAPDGPARLLPLDHRGPGPGPLPDGGIPGRGREPA